MTEKAANAPETPSYWQGPSGKAVKTGAKWGMVAGFVVAQWYMSRWMFHGFYLGNDALVFAVCIGIGTAIGGGIGWLSTQKFGDDDEWPPPPRPIEPIE
jgi:hypothetical protein